MSRRRGRRGHGGHADAHPDERWLVSYADMITVLMCLFIVLFAMSTVDANKYAQLRDSLATGFGTTPSENVDAATGVIVDPQYVDAGGVGFSGSARIQTELAEAKDAVAQFQALAQQVQDALAAQGLSDQTQVVLDERGLTIKLLGGQTYFAGDSAQLQPAAVAVIDAVGALLAPMPNKISVEGYVDPFAFGIPNDWVLAGERSVAVLRYLVDRGVIAGDRISATSFGGSDPAVPDASPQNRRVDIVVLNGLDSEAAAFVPGLLDPQKSPTPRVKPGAGSGEAPPASE